MTRRAVALRVGGAALEAQWIGPDPGEAPTLVFLHGGLACAATWRDFPERLAEVMGWGALVYSRLGHGSSDPGPGRWPVSFMHDEAAEGLPAVLTALEVRDPILVGHSDGASIALLYAGSLPAGAPSPRVLLLEAPHVFVEERTVASIAALREDAAFVARLRRHHGAKAEALFDAWSDVWLRDEFRTWNVEGAARGVSQPVLVVQGDADEYGTLAQVDAVRRACRGTVEAFVLPGCGHVPHRDRPLETRQAMAAFLRRHAGGYNGPHG